MDLAADRPEASRLTEFYFWLSFGGMLGGLFNTLVAPQVFTSVAEYPLAVLMGCLLVRPMNAATGRPAFAALVPIAIAFLTAVALLIPRTMEVPKSIQLAALAVPALLVFTQRRQGARFGWSATAMLAETSMKSAEALRDSGDVYVSSYSRSGTSSGTKSGSGAYQTDRYGSGRGAYTQSGESAYNSSGSSISGRAKRVYENVVNPTGRQALGRLPEADPFLEPNKEFIFVTRFDGVRPGNAPNTAPMAALTILTYYAPGALLLE